ncbi:fibrobacter succinogenes major paralogous domain-containing protein [Flavobacteriaceae bacterium]|nr:fibrobacter succinogenes major paralogous domain-containing protein [Flavobacteriaceae bacterium]
MKHLKQQLLTLLFVAAGMMSFAQVGIGTADPKAALDVVSTTQGFIMPRVADHATLTVGIDQTGMQVYDTTTKSVWTFDGSVWIEAGDSGVINAGANVTVTGAGTSASPYVVSTDANKFVDGTTAADAVFTGGNVGVGTTTPEGALDVVSTNSGLIVPRVANTSDVTTAVNGMLIYEIASRCIRAYENNAWTACLSSTGSAPTPEVTSSTGKSWMDKNLGATQVATSSTDVDAYGDLYQWGRYADGHQIRTSTTAAGPVAAGSEGSDFISNSSISPYDWLSTQDDTRWNSATKGAHDPCPAGFRVPTEAELNAELSAFSTNDAAGAFASALKLPVGGNRFYSNGSLYNLGSFGFYWSSTVSGTNARALYLSSSNAGMGSDFRATGFSVRCIKE